MATTEKGDALNRFIDLLHRHSGELHSMEADLEKAWGVGGGRDARALKEVTDAVLVTIRDTLLAEAKRRGIRP